MRMGIWHIDSVNSGYSDYHWRKWSLFDGLSLSLNRTKGQWEHGVLLLAEPYEATMHDHR